MIALDRREEGSGGGGTDHVALALASLAAGAGTGGMVVAGGVFLFRVTAGPRALLDAAVLAGSAAAAAMAWRLAADLPDGWRRGLTAALAAFGGLLLGALTAPAHMVAGNAGVLVLGGLAAGGAVWAGRAARRVTRP